jgi:glucoside 3-dehydrogenase (cytochrome c) hitch-hiker subunit
MERREAIKNMGFGSMALFTSTALFGALQGCSSAPEVEWNSVYLTSKEAAQLEKICEGILPKTETPGATDAGVAKHLDQALSVIYKNREAEFFKKGMAVFVDRFGDNGDVGFGKANTDQITNVINSYFKKYKEDETILKDYRTTFNDEGNKTHDFLETYFVTNVVDSTFWSYFTSELVGEEVMRYDPIPGKYEGCIPYEKGDKSWSSV